MQEFDESDLIVLVLLAGWGFTWSVLAIVAATTWRFPPPHLDLPGVLSVLAFWPLYLSSASGPVLYRVGLYDDPLVITMAIGVFAGLSGGVLVLTLDGASRSGSGDTTARRSGNARAKRPARAALAPSIARAGGSRVIWPSRTPGEPAAAATGLEQSGLGLSAHAAIACRQLWRLQE